MASPALLFNARIHAATDEAQAALERELLAMERRRSAAGSYLSGAMLQEVGTRTGADMQSLCANAETCLADAWASSVWVTRKAELLMLEAAGTCLARIRDIGLGRLEQSKRLQLPSAAIAQVQQQIDRRFDACREALVRGAELQRRKESLALIKRTVRYVGALLSGLFKWLIAVLR